jgi:glycosyltransferase involved in cell wall biosynthesis
MKILQIAPLWESVPPPAYGGTEAVVYLLCEELVRRGHDVTLWASGDSRTSARLRSCFPRSLRTARDIQAKSVYSWQHCVFAMAEAGQYDIVHNHAGEEVMALSHLAPEAPMLTTMHCQLTPDTKFIWDHYQGWYNTISWAQKRVMPETGGGKFVGVAYNGIDVASFPFQAEKEDFLLYLARISPEKGPHLAVEVARRTGRRLIIAGKVDDADYNFFLSTVAPLIDGRQVVYVGEADAKMKRDLYRRASALVVPIMWEEPFGLVFAEAQAAGTPVLTFNRGAAPEIVMHGETGFVVENTDQLVECVGYLREIDPRRCREHVEQNFDAPVMAEAYLRLYDIVLGRRSGLAAPLAAAAEGEDGERIAAAGQVA